MWSAEAASDGFERIFGVGQRLSPDEEASRLALYREGLSDAEIGRRVGCTGIGILHWRRSRGIPRHEWPDASKRSASHGWQHDPAMRARALEAYVGGGTILGVARRLNITRDSLTRVLRREGVIRRREDEDTAPYDAAIATYLSGVTVEVAARQHHIGPRKLSAKLQKTGQIRQHKFHVKVPALRDPAIKKLLGIIPDSHIARRIGCSPSTVLVYRRSLFIPPAFYVKVQALREPAIKNLLGHFSDALIARHVGCHASTVSDFRNSLGIPRHQPTKLARTRIVSIDEPRLFGGSLHEVFEDTTWSDWLEEAGATVW